MSLDAPVSVDENGNTLTYVDIISDERDGLDNYIDEMDSKDRFHRFYFALPQTYQKILKLRYDGLRQYQIAERMDLSQSYVSRLLKKMKVAYKESV